MRSLIRTVFAVVALFFALTLARPASALEPAYTAGRGQFMGGPRIGTDNIGFGLGVRGGYTLDMGLYLGGTFDYFFGDSDRGYGYEFSYHWWTLAFEAGYDFGVAERFIIRPFGGLGVIGSSVESCYDGGGPFRGCRDGSNTDAVFVMGGLMHYMLTEKLLIGPDLRLYLFDHPGSDLSAIFGGHFGLVF
jgi:hypothetical protein